PPALAAAMPQHPVREAILENGALKLRLHVRKTPWKGAQICIVAENAGDSVRWILPVPSASRRVHLRDADTGALLRLATVRVHGRDAEINIPIAAVMPLERLFVKFERRVLFFDEAGWREVPLPEVHHEKSAAPNWSPWRIF